MLISFFPADEVQRLSRPRGLVPVAQDSNEIRKIEGDCFITILLPNIGHEGFSAWLQNPSLALRELDLVHSEQGQSFQALHDLIKHLLRRL